MLRKRREIASELSAGIRDFKYFQGTQEDVRKDIVLLERVY